MITVDKFWINIIPSDKTGRWGSSGGIDGKWLVFGPREELHLYQELLNKLVEEGTFKKIKIAVKDPAHDPFPHKECVMCVFTSSDDNERAEVARHLREIDLNPVEWKSEKSTIADWRDDGKLYLQDQINKEKKKLRRNSPPIQNPKNLSGHVFISYSNNDCKVAGEVCSALEACGYKCWFAERDVLPGKHYDEEIVDGIESSVVIIALISSHSIVSKHVRREIEIGLSSGKALLPVKIEDVEVGKKLRYFLAGLQILDICGTGNQLNFAKINDVVKQFAIEN